MNEQARDLVIGMKKAHAFCSHCGLCGKPLTTENVYTNFATVCKACADETVDLPAIVQDDMPYGC